MYVGLFPFQVIEVANESLDRDPRGCNIYWEGGQYNMYVIYAYIYINITDHTYIYIYLLQGCDLTDIDDFLT